jgi:23S rRNA (guanine745-N1)-methyltransferase
MTFFDNLICPLDNRSLNRREGSFTCPKGHTFDLAREQYLNLLLVQNKTSKQPGDSKDMVSARQRFLNSGAYAQLVDRLIELIDDGSKLSALMDAGCGEGYYLRRIQKHFEGNCAPQLLGLDISKIAIIAAAKSARDISWLVASNKQIPVADNSLDVLLCAFGFPAPAEFLRVLKPGARLFLIEPDADHLIELRQAVYSALFDSKVREFKALEGFSEKTLDKVRYKTKVTGPELLQDLLLMTPHFFRTNAENKAQLSNCAELDLTVDVQIASFAKL